jgi:hypothetical protein
MKPASLAAALERISSDRRRVVAFQRMTWIWLALAAALIAYLAGARLFNWNAPFFMPSMIAVGVVAWFVVRSSANRLNFNLLDIAREVESGDARLNSLLLAAYEEQQRAGNEGLSYLQERVILEALEANRRSPWGQQFAEKRFFKAVRHGLSFAVFLIALILVSVTGPRGSILTALLGGVSVTPGTAEVEKGTALAIMAKFPEPPPPEARLLIMPKAGPVRTMPMERALQDPVFGASFPDVQEDFAYQVEYKGKKTLEYKISVFEFPILKRADAQLKFPEFTGLGEKRIDDTRRVSAVEGTKVDFRLELNKPVKSATLVSKSGESVPLTKDEKFPNVYHAKIELLESLKLSLALKDEAGRTNKAPQEFALDALPNKEPAMKIMFPRGDQRISALEEVSLQAEVRDDFGLGAYGLAYSMGGDEPKYIKIGEKGAANEKKTLAHLLRVEELGAQTDQLISYFAWAEDLGPDGKVRRTESDMYFAEVRPFEEIFRKGDGQQQQQQQQQQGQQGQQSPSEKLADLQKEIINATWKLQRTESKTKPSPKFKDNITVVRDSQQKALSQADELTGQSQDPKAISMAAAVVTEMKKALAELSDSTSKKSTEPLPKALSAERAAYEALLKLQAREYRVSRQRGGGGGGGGRQQGAQRQLDELDLKDEKNRYETQSQAQAPKNAEQQEQMQVLNKLKDLARRQSDITERLQELQAALQEAKTEQEKEELRRRLKRLSEEQQDAVKDMDELQQQMAKSENQSQMGEAREKLDQARSQAQKAGEQMGEKSLGQAASSAARTEKDLKKLTEDFRKATAQQFNDEMRDMRRNARDLDEKEKEIAEKLQELKTPKQRTLGDDGGKDQVARQLAQQKTNYANIVERMKKVSQESEQNEPLLSQKLYDTVRQMNQQNTEQALDSASEFVRRSFIPQASQVEDKARKNIENLRAGIDEAARKLLGDEAESLRLAARELDDLARRLQNEAGRNGTNQSMAAAGPSTVANTNRVAGANPGRNGEPQPNGERGERGEQQAANGQGENQQGQREGQQQGQGQRQGQRQQASNQQGQRGQRGGQQQGQGQQGQEGQQPGEQQGQGQGQGEGQQQANNESQQQGQQQGGQQGGGRGGQRNQANAGGNRFFNRGGNNNNGGASGPAGNEEGPITGNNFREWNDRLRDVQEMIDDPDLRNQLAQIQDRARAMRSEFTRHSKGPEWNLLNTQVVKPLVEVRQRVAEELARRDASTVAPLDRDPVPGRYAELVSRYYQSLGQGGAAPKNTPTAP